MEVFHKQGKEGESETECFRRPSTERPTVTEVSRRVKTGLEGACNERLQKSSTPRGKGREGQRSAARRRRQKTEASYNRRRRDAKQNIKDNGKLEEKKNKFWGVEIFCGYVRIARGRSSFLCPVVSSIQGKELLPSRCVFSPSNVLRERTVIQLNRYVKVAELNLLM